jgi:hypothetical protein
LIWASSIREADRLEVGLRAATERACFQPAGREPRVG